MNKNRNGNKIGSRLLVVAVCPCLPAKIRRKGNKRNIPMIRGLEPLFIITVPVPVPFVVGVSGSSGGHTSESLLLLLVSTCKKMISTVIKVMKKHT